MTSFIITTFSLGIGIFILIKILNRKRITINWSEGLVYGWYNLEILVSNSFNRNNTYEEISKIVEKTKKELEERIKIYKKLNQ